LTFHHTKSFNNVGITRELMMSRTPSPTCGFCKIFLLLLIQVEFLTNFRISAFTGFNFFRIADICLLSKLNLLSRMFRQHSLIANMFSSEQICIKRRLSFPTWLLKILIAPLNDSHPLNDSVSFIMNSTLHREHKINVYVLIKIKLT